MGVALLAHRANGLEGLLGQRSGLGGSARSHLNLDLSANLGRTQLCEYDAHQLTRSFSTKKGTFQELFCLFVKDRAMRQGRTSTHPQLSIRSLTSSFWALSIDSMTQQGLISSVFL